MINIQLKNKKAGWKAPFGINLSKYRDFYPMLEVVVGYIECYIIVTVFSAQGEGLEREGEPQVCFCECQ